MKPEFFKQKNGVSASDRLNVAVVGAGGQGHKGILAISRNPLVNLIAFADVDDERSSITFEMFPRVPRYRDLKDMEEKTGLACQMVNLGHSGTGNFPVHEWVKMGLPGEVFGMEPSCMAAKIPS